MRSDLHDIEVIYQTATDRGVCVRADEGADDVWLPLAQVEIAPRAGGPLRRGHVAVLTAPENLLTEKGLI